MLGTPLDKEVLVVYQGCFMQLIYALGSNVDLCTRIHLDLCQHQIFFSIHR